MGGQVRRYFSYRVSQRAGYHRKNTEVRHGAFIRGSALVGDSAVVGNSTELKNVILFNNVQVPHYNYVGDSILATAPTWARALLPPM